MSRPLEGRRALVTGVDSGGIGQGIALELARQGASVICHYPFDDKGARETVAEIESMGGSGGLVQGDFREGGDLYTRVVAGAASQMGGIDILVNNAGLTREAPLDDISPQLFQELFAINVGSHLFCARASLPFMDAAGGGSIINLASVHAYGGAPGFSIYAATKGAIAAMTREMAVELGPRQIRVNAIAPGLIEVPRYYDDPDYDPNSYAATVPWGRLGNPGDIAGVAAFLSTDAAEFITGQVLYVDGGTTAYMSFIAHLDGQQKGKDR